MQPQPNTLSSEPSVTVAETRTPACRHPDSHGILARLGEILYRAACRLQVDAPAEESAASVGLSSNQAYILATLAELGSAAPNEMLARVDMSRATLARELQTLRSQELVHRTGQTRRTRYSLTAAGNKKSMSQPHKFNPKSNRAKNALQVKKPQTGDAT